MEMYDYFNAVGSISKVLIVPLIMLYYGNKAVASYKNWDKVTKKSNCAKEIRELELYFNSQPFVYYRHNLAKLIKTMMDSEGIRQNDLDFDFLFNFFETIANHYNNGIIDLESTCSTFFYWINHYMYLASPECSVYIEAERIKDLSQWRQLLELHPKLVKIKLDHINEHPHAKKDFYNSNFKNLDALEPNVKSVKEFLETEIALYNSLYGFNK
jgi:hypothetical protein